MTHKPKSPPRSETSAGRDRVAVVDLAGLLACTLVVFSDRGLVALRAWGDVPSGAGLREWLRSVSAPDALEVPAEAVPSALVDPLRAFSAGEPVDLATLPVDLRGSPFHVEVYRALLRVPRGSVRTYQGLATDAGSPRAMRAVGQAMAKNPLPIVVPCHRVVAAGGALGGYTGGVERKRKLLALEGVSVVGDQVRAGQLDLYG